jgi:hypothetical protein
MCPRGGWPRQDPFFVVGVGVTDKLAEAVRTVQLVAPSMGITVGLLVVGVLGASLWVLGVVRMRRASVDRNPDRCMRSPLRS